MLNKKEKDYLEWFKRAEDDELSIKAILKEGAPSTACFLSQQMAEKYLKAFLVFSKDRFPKIHQVDHLLELCIKIDPEFEKLKKETILLSDYYVETRYPGDYLEFSKKECKQAYEAAVRIKEFVSQKISQ